MGMRSRAFANWQVGCVLAGEVQDEEQAVRIGDASHEAAYRIMKKLAKAILDEHDETFKKLAKSELAELLEKIRQKLLSNTVKLDEESSKLLYDNLWDLYLKDDDYDQGNGQPEE